MRVYSQEYPKSDSRHIETCKKLRARGILHTCEGLNEKPSQVIITVHYAPPNALAFLKQLNFTKENSDES